MYAVFTRYNVASVAAGNSTSKLYGAIFSIMFFLTAPRPGAIPKRSGAIASNAQV